MPFFLVVTWNEIVIERSPAALKMLFATELFHDSVSKALLFYEEIDRSILTCRERGV